MKIINTHILLLFLLVLSCSDSSLSENDINFINNECYEDTYLKSIIINLESSSDRDTSFEELKKKMQQSDSHIFCSVRSKAEGWAYILLGGNLEKNYSFIEMPQGEKTYIRIDNFPNLGTVLGLRRTIEYKNKTYEFEELLRLADEPNQ